MPKHSSGCRTWTRGKAGGGGEGGGVLNNRLHGAAPPQGPTLTLLYTIFNEKGIPFAFRIPFTD